MVQPDPDSAGLDERIADLFAARVEAGVSARDAGIYVGSDIPMNMLERARAAFAPYDQDEGVLGLVDATAFGSGEKGLLLTRRRLFFTPAPPHPSASVQRSYQEIGYTAADGQTLRFEDGSEVVLVADAGLVSALAAFLNDARDAAAGVRGEVTRPAAAIEADDQRYWAVCWFCGRNAPDERHAVPTVLQRQRRVRNQENPQELDVETEQVTLRVPRCASCAAAHEKREGRAAWVYGLGLILLVCVWAGGWWAGYPKTGFVLGAACMAAVGYLGARMENRGAAGVKAPIDKIDFPPAKRLETQGWTQTETREITYT